MEKIMSEEALVEALNRFRKVLINYDFTEVKNIIFFDMESLRCYLAAYKNNPFERQYQEMDSILDQILAYIPSALSSDTVDVLNVLLNQDIESSRLKDNIMMNMKMDFIELVKNMESDTEWEQLVEYCKGIRMEKEEEMLSGRY